MSKKIKYKPIKADVIDLDLAVTEFVQLMQIAGQIATEERDFKKIMKLSELWFEFVKVIEPSEDEEITEAKQYGFEIPLGGVQDGISTDED